MTLMSPATTEADVDAHTEIFAKRHLSCFGSRYLIQSQNGIRSRLSAAFETACRIAADACAMIPPRRSGRTAAWLPRSADLHRRI
jgi:hypothetical protein